MNIFHIKTTGPCAGSVRHQARDEIQLELIVIHVKFLVYHTQATLYTYPNNFRAYKGLIAAQYSGAKVTVASDFVFGQTNTTEAYLKKFPTGKVSDFFSSKFGQ